jgi:hypothetical protein
MLVRTGLRVVTAYVIADSFDRHCHFEVKTATAPKKDQRIVTLHLLGVHASQFGAWLLEESGEVREHVVKKSMPDELKPMCRDLSLARVTLGRGNLKSQMRYFSSILKGIRHCSTEASSCS